MSVQLTTVEGKQRKKFTANQRLEILREWDATGNGVEVSRRHGIHPLTLYRWKKRLEQGAAEFLKGTRSKPNPEVKELQRENQKLKDTVTLLSQELMLLKKKMNLV
ncbi:MAG: transposase [Desulfomonilaceae bacterium]